jgi:hypothetical protein
MLSDEASMQIKVILSLLLIATTLQASYANQSVEVWRDYFPNTNCSQNPCGRDLPTEALEEFLEKAWRMQRRKFTSTTWSFLVDFTLSSDTKRGFLINMRTGASEDFYISHGIGSDDGFGNAVRFSNVYNSLMSSLGLYLTAETYYGINGYSLRLDGLERTNSNARRRAVVVHSAEYMTPRYIQENDGRNGLSEGCPALDPRYSRRVIDSLKGGSLYYIYYR